MNDDHRQAPTEPAGDDKGKPVVEGFAGLARRLNEIHPSRKRPISRQLVHKWWLHRSYNSFPEPVAMTGGGIGRPLFDTETVIDWYRRYRKYHGEILLPQAVTPRVPTEHLPQVSEHEEKHLAA